MNRNFTQKPLISKSQLRNKFILLRNGLTGAEVSKKSGLIGQKLLTTAQIATAKSVSAYLPIHNEVDTRLIIDHLTSTGKKIFLPKYFPANTPGVKAGRHPGNTPGVKYRFAEFTGWQNLEKGPFGILQPSISSPKANTLGVSFASSHTPGVNSNQIQLDLAIIPGVAFDKKGTRLGYGKGVFDKLLTDSKAFKIGLAYDFQIVDKIPREKHDLIMDLIVTEKRVIRS